MPNAEGHVAGCDFCTIATGRTRSVQIVCDSEQWIAFFPLRPATKGHTIVIPRRHIHDLWEVEEPLSSEQ